MSIEFPCTHCANVLSASDSQIGMMMECPECGQTVFVQQVEREPEQPETSIGVSHEGGLESGLFVPAPSEFDSDVAVPEESESADTLPADLFQPAMQQPPAAASSPESSLPESSLPEREPEREPEPAAPPEASEQQLVWELPEQAPEPQGEIGEEAPPSDAGSVPEFLAPDATARDAAAAAAAPVAVPRKTTGTAPTSEWWKKPLVPILASYVCGVIFGLIFGRMLFSGAEPEKVIVIQNDHGVHSGGKKWVGPDPKAALPRSMRTRLGGKVQAGDLEVTAVSVARETITKVHFTDPAVRKPSQEECLVLKVRLKNNSSDLAFSPLDEMFLRESEYPSYSFIELAKGDAIPMYGLAPLSEFNIEGQSFDELAPGQEMDAVIVAEEGSPARAQGDMLWRVLLRAGGKPGRTYAMVVGVDFGAGEIGKKD